jgi:hypothetical protein
MSVPENAKLRPQIAALEKENALLQLEELKVKIFGGKHKKQLTEKDGSQPRSPVVLPCAELPPTSSQGKRNS